MPSLRRTYTNSQHSPQRKIQGPSQGSIFWFASAGRASPAPLPRGTYIIVDPLWPHSSTSGITSSGTPWIAWGQTLDRMQEYGGDEHLITQSYLLKYIIRRLFYAPPPEHYRTAKLSRLPESGKVLAAATRQTNPAYSHIDTSSDGPGPGELRAAATKTTATTTQRKDKGGRPEA